MGLTAKRPSRGDEARQRILQEVTGTASEKKKRLNAEIEESLYVFFHRDAAQANPDGFPEIVSVCVAGVE